MRRRTRHRLLLPALLAAACLWVPHAGAAVAGDADAAGYYGEAPQAAPRSTKILAALPFARSFAALTPLPGGALLLSGGQRTRGNASDADAEDSPASLSAENAPFWIVRAKGGGPPALPEPFHFEVEERPVGGLPASVRDVLWSHAALADPDGSRVWIVHASGVGEIGTSSWEWKDAAGPPPRPGNKGPPPRTFYFGAAWGTGSTARWIFVAGGNVHSRGQWSQRRLFAGFDTSAREWHDLSLSPAALPGGPAAYSSPPSAPYERCAMVRLGTHLALYSVSELWTFDLADPGAGWLNATSLVPRDPASPVPVDRKSNLPREPTPFSRPRLFPAFHAVSPASALLLGGLSPSGASITPDLWHLSARGPPEAGGWSWRLLLHNAHHPADDHNPLRRWAPSLATDASRARVAVWGGVAGTGLGTGRVGGGDGDAGWRELDVSGGDPGAWDWARRPLLAEEGGDDEVPPRAMAGGGRAYVLLLPAAALALCAPLVLRAVRGRSARMDRLHRVPSRASRIVPQKISFVGGGEAEAAMLGSPGRRHGPSGGVGGGLMGMGLLPMLGGKSMTD